MGKRGRKPRKSYLFQRGNYFGKKNFDSNSSVSSTSSRDDSMSSTSTREPAIIRPSRSLFDGVQYNGEEDNSDAPMLLRPPKKKEIQNSETGKCNKENFIVNMEKMNNLFQTFLDKHDSKICTKPETEIIIVKRLGLGVSAEMVCKKCQFKSPPSKLYEEGKGRSVLTNKALALPLLKTKMGATDVQFLLASLNIKPPSLRGLQDTLNSASVISTNINKESMLNNQVYVRKVQELKGQGHNVDVEMDTSYNNRPQNGIEAGTISITPVAECSTNRKLVIALNVCNKLCNKKSCDHTSCAKSYPTDKSITSSEAFSVAKNLKSIQDNNILNVRSVTTDQSCQVEKVISDTSRHISHYHCFIHRLRNLQKKIQNIKMKSFLAGIDNSTFSRRVSCAIRSRVYIELTRLNKTERNRANFMRKSKLTIQNVVPCLTGDHTKCQLHSKFCRPSTRKLVLRDLPGREFLTLTDHDEECLASELSKFVNNTNGMKLRVIRNTNKVESVHNRCFTVAPKNTNWPRNIEGLCHSAVHSDTHSHGQSTTILAETLGISYGKKDPFTSHMASLDKRYSYDKLRKKSHQYRTNRYNKRLRRVNRRINESSFYSDATGYFSREHSYATNPTNE
ncbi:hypothetical protein FSP39_019512 [Pinctada imbricata]|uniref:Mutator-like transposase domain-containing protein n=1 Tax=Pinctada imbricata TaxID=66713 RepID=A0AA89BUK8_PINIB|nr:hypothetical protein FSP39_019512 [Pinctada imbricata]